jgi:hypothetical protein
MRTLIATLALAAALTGCTTAPTGAKWPYVGPLIRNDGTPAVAPAWTNAPRGVR